MKKILIEISHPPFGPENTFTGLYVATASLSKGMDVIVVMIGDGVLSGRKKSNENYKNPNLPDIENQIEDILELDGRVVADNQALLLRGIGRKELIYGIEILDTHDIQDIILNYGEHIIAF